MLFYKIEKNDWNLLVTFLVFLNKMPEVIPGTNIISSDIKLDENIISELRKI
jgi:hypothetical protein